MQSQNKTAKTGKVEGELVHQHPFGKIGNEQGSKNIPTGTMRPPLDTT
jgi:hypothetical protein